jgi:hypothetical protein
VSLYQDLNGRLACFDHIGAYAQAAFSRSPRSRRQETPLTVWERLSKADISSIDEEFAKYGMEGSVMCDECAYAIIVANKKKLAL